MNSGCDECEQTFSSKICHENLGLYFCNPFQKFLLSSLKEIENQPKSSQKVLVRNCTAINFALP